MSSFSQQPDPWGLGFEAWSVHWWNSWIGIQAWHWCFNVSLFEDLLLRCNLYSLHTSHVSLRFVWCKMHSRAYGDLKTATLYMITNLETQNRVGWSKKYFRISNMWSNCLPEDILLSKYLVNIHCDQICLEFWHILKVFDLSRQVRKH